MVVVVDDVVVDVVVVVVDDVVASVVVVVVVSGAVAEGGVKGPPMSMHPLHAKINAVICNIVCFLIFIPHLILCLVAVVV